jgi:two-component system nitrogen regulation response regulator GlnG
MQAVFKRIALAAPRDSCVLITGESGTGKELVARALHRHSPRCEHPFLPVHVASLNPALVESELFGHVKGAFTGATESRPGLLALANGGTVFLDELADVSLAVQVKLLRVLEQNEVLPVGGKQPRPLDVRVLAATHQDLPRRVADGSFRHDLYFRLNVFQIHLPPLRERPEDILPLAEHFLRRLEPAGVPLLAETVKFLSAQPWPGNVRELRNALEHAAIVARGGPLLPQHFPPFYVSPDPLVPKLEFGNEGAAPLAASIRRWLAEQVNKAAPAAPADLHTDLIGQAETALLEDVMRRVRGNRWVAAQWLGLNRATVRKKLAHYDLHQMRNGTEEDEYNQELE